MEGRNRNGDQRKGMEDYKGGNGEAWRISYWAWRPEEGRGEGSGRGFSGRLEDKIGKWRESREEGRSPHLTL